MVIGHQLILSYLKKSIANKRLAHAYLFAGSANVGKKTVALAFVKHLTGQNAEGLHPDVLLVEPAVEEKKGVKKELEISIDQARRIRKQMSLSPHQANYKAAIIDQAEKMSRQAANALLKTLEEPAGRVIIILIATSPKALPETIVSRCQLVNFLPVAAAEIKKKLPKASDKIIRRSCGRPGLVINYLENPALIKGQQNILDDLNKLLSSDLNSRYLYVEKLAKDVSLARSVLSTWLLFFRDLALIKAGCVNLTIFSNSTKFKNQYSLNKIKGIIQAVKNTDWLIANPSINARLALEVLMLDI